MSQRSRSQSAFLPIISMTGPEDDNFTTKDLSFADAFHDEFKCSHGMNNNNRNTKMPTTLPQFQQYTMTQQQQQQQQPSPPSMGLDNSLGMFSLAPNGSYLAPADPGFSQFTLQSQQQPYLPQQQPQQQQQQQPFQYQPLQQPLQQPLPQPQQTTTLSQYVPLSQQQQQFQPQQLSQPQQFFSQQPSSYMFNQLPDLDQTNEQAFLSMFSNPSLSPNNQPMVPQQQSVGLVVPLSYEESMANTNQDLQTNRHTAHLICEHDGNCLLRKCTRLHPRGTGFHTPETCPRGVDCPNKTTDCPYKFHTPCAFDGHCTNPKCTFIHKKQVQQPKLCPKDGSCTYRGCGYLHPNGTGEYLHTMCPFGVKCGFQTTSCPYTIHSLSSNNSPLVIPMSSSPTKSRRHSSGDRSFSGSLLSSTATSFTPIEISTASHSRQPSNIICSRDGECTHRQCELDHPSGRGFIDRMCMRGSSCQYQGTTCKFKHGNETHLPQQLYQQQQQTQSCRLKHHISH